MSATVIILAALTAFLVVFTWFSSIREKRYHGYPRFFAFESVFVLIALNWGLWFRDPFSIRQIVSWLLFAASIAVVAAGFLALKKYGKPDGPNFENTTRLVDRGIFRFIRHPMYASLVYMDIGAFLKGIRLSTAIVLAAGLIACGLTAFMEEREMKAKFGEEYLAYMKRTRRFVPFFI